MSKVILISQFPLPYQNIGSWTAVFKNYLEKTNSIDLILCEKPEFPFASTEYIFVERTFLDKIKNKFLGRRKAEFVRALVKVVNTEDKFIIQLIDNYGMVKPLQDFLVKKGIRQNCYIQFFYRGFDAYIQADSSNRFYNLVDEVVVLTQSSYEDFKNKITVLPNFFSVLHNGIDTNKFQVITEVAKASLKKSLGLEDKTLFLWCSQDRPKKGLHIVLDAWSQIYAIDKNIELIVIGCDKKAKTAGVNYMGRIANDHLPKYYQMADCYLFPTMCHEGFGLSLVEALHCGCYCIASESGGVPEVLAYGKYGKLVKRPNFVSDWADAMQDFLNSDFRYPELAKNIYSTETWNSEMNQIIETAKHRLTHRI